MIGTTLNGIYDYLHSLADEDGDYYLICGRYGDRPVPVADLRFDTRATARAAARATEQYRRALRRYDPQVPYYDVIVCQDTVPILLDDPNGVCCDSTHHTYEECLSEPVVNSSPVGDREFVEFCHRVAAVVFETLSKHGYDAVESAIMDAYFAHAEELSEPDELCLRLLESIAVELSDQLDPSEQVTFLSAAAGRLEYTAGVTGSTTRSSGAGSVDESLSALEEIGLFRRGTRAVNPEAVGGRSEELVIKISEYTLRPHDGRLPLLPIALTIHRCDNAWVPIHTDVSDDRCQVVFRPFSDSEMPGQPAQVFAPEVR